MSGPGNSTGSPLMTLDQVCRLVSDPARWAVLRELLKGEALPPMELARRAGRSRDAISKHLAVMRRAGVVMKDFGGLYTISPPFRAGIGAGGAGFGPLPPAPGNAAGVRRIHFEVCRQSAATTALCLPAGRGGEIFRR